MCRAARSTCVSAANRFPGEFTGCVMDAGRRIRDKAGCAFMVDALPCPVLSLSFSGRQRRITLMLSSPKLQPIHSDRKVTPRHYLRWWDTTCGVRCHSRAEAVRYFFSEHLALVSESGVEVDDLPTKHIRCWWSYEWNHGGRT